MRPLGQGSEQRTQAQAGIGRDTVSFYWTSFSTPGSTGIDWSGIAM